MYKDWQVYFALKCEDSIDTLLLLYSSSNILLYKLKKKKGDLVIRHPKYENTIKIKHFKERVLGHEDIHRNK